MAENLVIVESPAKAGTIGKYLGSKFQVIASMGHIRDLPSSKLGVDVTDKFAPQYIIPVKARKAFSALKKALVGKKAVYLATDLDREGEAIAWHIAEALELTKRDDLQLYRITFDEITKDAVTHAVANPRDLDRDLIDAQQARRVLDRLVGYTLSPVLWRKIYKGLSAGRVQSAALRLIVDREAERNAFQPVEYWSLKALLQAAAGELTANIVQYQGKKLEAQSITNQEMVDGIVQSLQKATYTVRGIESKQVKRHPSAPYTTSSFQQDAVNKLGMSSKNAMRTAQKLYEAGHITYMRTDSVDMGIAAKDAIRSLITSEYGAAYVPDKPNFYKTKTKQAQEAHEAIRPTDPYKRGSDVTGDAAGQKVYDLIRRRAIASQMASAQIEQMAISIEAGEAQFRATGQRILFPGFLSVWKGEDADGEATLPAVKEGEVLTLRELLPEQHFTEPPPRFSEATLIKTLEELGIGRPSTYAPTIDTLTARRYVVLEQRRFAPEEVGTIVINLLKEHFPQIVDLNFTAAMEEQLDAVATGEDTYEALLSTFWGPFEKLVQEKTDSIEKVTMEEETDEVCPTCGAPMVIKTGRFGKFLACTKFPECKTTKPLNQKAPTGLICPVCGKELAERRARRGMFFGCSGYPACTFAIWKREQLPAKIEELEKAGEKLAFKDASLTAFNTPPTNAG